jgi:hypothetical protein
MAKDVFQHYDRIIDQSRKDQREAAKYHRIDRTVAKRKHDKCRQRRQWNGKKDCQRCPKVTQKNQNHDSGQN